MATTKPKARTTGDKPAAAQEATTETASSATVPAAPEAAQAEKPVSAPPARASDSRILAIAATIILEYPDTGATVQELAAHTGLDPEELTQLLSAMAFGQAAVKTESGDEVRWTLGSTKASQVDPAHLPPCPTCGLVPPAIGRKGSVRRRNGSGMNNDGSRPYGRGELEKVIERYLAERPGLNSGAAKIAKELSESEGRAISSGSVTYALDKMAKAPDFADPRK